MVKEFLKTYGIEVVIGTALMFYAMHRMEVIRGGWAIGGEILILPMIVFLKAWYLQMKEDGFFDMFLFGDDEDEEDEEDDV